MLTNDGERIKGQLKTTKPLLLEKLLTAGTMTLSAQGALTLDDFELSILGLFFFS